MAIGAYPAFTEVVLEDRGLLQGLLRSGDSDISEFTFANIYLFRKEHDYMVSLAKGNVLLVFGKGEGGERFFMVPGVLPDEKLLRSLFRDFSYMRNASMEQAGVLKEMGFTLLPDRDNFDYLYLRQDLLDFKGRRFHSRKNLVNAFLRRYRHEVKPLIKENTKDALLVLDEWRVEKGAHDDYESAKEALLNMEELSLCGFLHYVDDRPAGFILGEEGRRDTFIVHFEKGAPGIAGLQEFIFNHLATSLPDKYEFMNLEQDLGLPGLRAAKEGLRPIRFVEKFMAKKQI